MVWQQVAMVVLLAEGTGFADPYVPVYRSIDPISLHEGVTLELAVGAGVYSADRSEAAFQQSVSIGFWLNHRIAVLARTVNAGTNEKIFLGFDGAEVQVWLSSRAWFGAGYGLMFQSGNDYGFANFWTGQGYDARIGYSFGTTAPADTPAPTHSASISLELMGGLGDYPYASEKPMTKMLVFGYQYL